MRRAKQMICFAVVVLAMTSCGSPTYTSGPTPTSATLAISGSHFTSVVPNGWVRKTYTEGLPPNASLVEISNVAIELDASGVPKGTVPDNAQVLLVGTIPLSAFPASFGDLANLPLEQVAVRTQGVPKGTTNLQPISNNTSAILSSEPAFEYTYTSTYQSRDVEDVVLVARHDGNLYSLNADASQSSFGVVKAHFDDMVSAWAWT